MIDANAFYLPGFSEKELGRPAPLHYGDAERQVVLGTPVATPELVSKAIGRVKASRDAYLAEVPIEHIIDVIDATVGCWLDPAYHLRKIAEELLPAITGYSRPMVSMGIEEMLKPYRRDGLLQLLEGELGDPLVLDEFRSRGKGATMCRAYGPRLVAHVFSGNIPVLPIEGLVHALSLKSASFGKLASGEPLFPVLFARSLAEQDSRLAECIALLWWKGGSEGMEQVLFGAAGAVVAYGSKESVEAVRCRVPRRTKFLGYGHRLSLAAVGREALTKQNARAIAAGAALDVSFFDQQGCVSPHVVYVERGCEAAPAEFAALLAKEMDAVDSRLPRGRISPEEAAQIQQFRGANEFREMTGQGGMVYSSEGSTAWTVVFEDSPEFAPSCLNRVVRVKPLDDLMELLRLLEPVKEYLQTIGIAASEERTKALAEGLGRLGASRICTIGRMQYPPASWHHDGRPNLSELVRWVDLEG